MRTLPAITTTILLLVMAGAAAAQQLETDNPISEVDHAYEYVSQEGEFRVTWPRGCAKLHRRTSVDDPEADPFETVRVVHISCDRDNQQGEGFSVATIFNQLAVDGGIAGPAEVVDRLEEQIERFNVQVVEQRPIAREFESGHRIEGLDIWAVDARNVGQVWLRGLISNGDIYVLAAWNMAGSVWEDPEYQAFFASFLPGLE